MSPVRPCRRSAGDAPGARAGGASRWGCSCVRRRCVCARRGSRTLAELTVEQERSTQMGNQAGYNDRVIENVWAGRLGEIQTIQMWGGGGAGPRKAPSGTHEVPDYLNWDLWLGPAAYRPYHPDWMKHSMWRDFSCGHPGWWGAHLWATLYKTMKLETLWSIDKQPPAEVAAVIESIHLDSQQVLTRRYVLRKLEFGRRHAALAVSDPDTVDPNIECALHSAEVNEYASAIPVGRNVELEAIGADRIALIERRIVGGWFAGNARRIDLRSSFSTSRSPPGCPRHR